MTILHEKYVGAILHISVFFLNFHELTAMQEKQAHVESVDCRHVEQPRACFEIVNFEIKADISLPEVGVRLDISVDRVPKFLIKRPVVAAIREEISLDGLVRYINTYVQEYNDSSTGALLYTKLRPPALIFDEVEKLVLNVSRSCAWELRLCSNPGIACVFIVNKKKCDCASVVTALLTRGFLYGKIFCASDDSNINDPAVVKTWYTQVLGYLNDVYWYWLFRPGDDGDTVLVDDYP